MKDYSQPYETPYYAELKRCGICLPCFLTHIRTDAARIEKPKDAKMFRMMFLAPRNDGCCGTIDTSSQTNLIMEWNAKKVMCVASRGRGEKNIQSFEARTDGCTSTVTSVTKDNFLMELRFPCVLNKQRSEEGKKIRRQYKNDRGVPYQVCKVQLPKTDGISPCITTFQTDTEIMEMTKDNPGLVYHEHPTKEDLLEYFGQRIRVRKMTEREAMRLMDVEDSDIDKIMNATETVTLKDGTVKTKKAISKTAMYRLAGNSIVVSCLYHIFRTAFIPGQTENDVVVAIQPSLFD